MFDALKTTKNLAVYNAVSVNLKKDTETIYQNIYDENKLILNQTVHTTKCVTGEVTSSFIYLFITHGIVN